MRQVTATLTRIGLGFWFIAMATVFAGGAASAQTREDNTVAQSIEVFREVMEIPANGIPAGLLKDAHGVAVIPRVIKGSFVVGARHGNGVLLVRDEQGSWHAPVFITLAGGNIGWQVGVQATDVVLIFKTPQSIQGIMNGKFTLGADAAVAAGPVGRQAAAGTDTRLSAEIYSYSRSRGLFAGVSFDGSVIQVDSLANASYYRAPSVGAPVVVPPAAQQLVGNITRFTGGGTNGAPPNPADAARNSQLAARHSKDEATLIRDELALVAPQLYKMLDPTWQNYLALPLEVYYENGHPTPEAMKACLDRFEVIRRDPQYTRLAELPEFQSTYGLLKHYAQEMEQSPQMLTLPAPPPGAPAP